MADLHGKILDALPRSGSKLFQFYSVFGKIWQNRMLVPPPSSPRGGLVSPPRGNRGSATVNPVIIRPSLTGGNFFKPLMRTLQLLVTLCLLWKTRLNPKLGFEYFYRVREAKIKNKQSKRSTANMSFHNTRCFCTCIIYRPMLSVKRMYQCSTRGGNILSSTHFLFINI